MEIYVISGVPVWLNRYFKWLQNQAYFYYLHHLEENSSMGKLSFLKIKTGLQWHTSSPKKYNKNRTIKEQWRDQTRVISILINLKVPGLTCPGRKYNTASRIGSKHSRKKSSRQLVNCYSEHLHMSPRHSPQCMCYMNIHERTHINCTRMQAEQHFQGGWLVAQQTPCKSASFESCQGHHNRDT